MKNKELSPDNIVRGIRKLRNGTSNVNINELVSMYINDEDDEIYDGNYRDKEGSSNDYGGEEDYAAHVAYIPPY